MPVVHQGQPCPTLASLHQNRPPSQPRTRTSRTPPIDRLTCGEACQKHAGYVAVDSRLHVLWAYDSRVERPRSSAGSTPSSRMPLLPLDPSMIVYLPRVSRHVSSCTRESARNGVFRGQGTQGGFDGPAPDIDLPRPAAVVAGTMAFCNYNYLQVDHSNTTHYNHPESQILMPSYQQPYLTAVICESLTENRRLRFSEAVSANYHGGFS